MLCHHWGHPFAAPKAVGTSENKHGSSFQAWTCKHVPKQITWCNHSLNSISYHQTHPPKHSVHVASHICITAPKKPCTQDFFSATCGRGRYHNRLGLWQYAKLPFGWTVPKWMSISSICFVWHVCFVSGVHQWKFGTVHHKFMTHDSLLWKHHYSPTIRESVTTKGRVWWIYIGLWSCKFTLVFDSWLLRRNPQALGFIHVHVNRPVMTKGHSRAELAN